jgi:hypothetical protein
MNSVHGRRGGGEGLESLSKMHRQKSAKSHTVTIICDKLRLRESRKDLKIMKIKPFFSHGAFRYGANALLNDFQDKSLKILQIKSVACYSAVMRMAD